MWRAFLSVSVLLLLATPAHAQNNGQIFGKVTDASNAVLPGVTVTVSSPVLLQPRVTVTGPDGSYAVPGLPIGTFKVTFELSGFDTSARDGVQLTAEFSAQINAQLTVGTVKEAVVVVGTSPLVDTKSTMQGEHYSDDQLANIPTGRDVFSFLNKAPALLVAGQGVGGNTLGTQNGFISRGAAVAQIRTFSDGVDASAGNNQPFYFDFDVFQELEIKTGGADVTMQGSGTVINLISKSGSDTFSGTARGFFTGQSLEAQNDSTALRQQGATSGNPLLDLKDYGTEFGGPLLKNRLYYWGAISRQTVSNGVIGFYQTTAACAPIAANPISFSVSQVDGCLNPAVVDLDHVNYKLTYKPFRNNTFSMRNSYDLKTASNRGASSLTAPSATTVLAAVDDTSYGPKFWTTGWPALWHFDDAQTFGDRWLLDISYGRFCGCTDIEQASPSLVNVQPEDELSTGATSRSSASSITFPEKNRFEVTSTYFRPRWLGADHTVKMGVSDVYQWQDTESHTGGNAIANFSSGNLPAFTVPFSATFTRDSVQDQTLNQQSAYLQDSISRGRLTLILGVRWDRQTDAQGPIVEPASPFEGELTANGTVFNFLPAVTFPAVSGLPVWNDVAPRIGVTYDLTGKGTTLVKASFAQYYDQRSIGQLSTTLSNAGAASVTFPWTDLNGDGIVEANEVNTTKILSFSGVYNPANPAQTTSPNSVDPNIQAPKTDEAIVSFDKQLSASMDVNVSYIYRHYGDFIYSPKNGLSSANYTAVQFTPAASACPAGASCPAITYFVPNISLPSPFTLTNEPGYSQRYQGLEAELRKRFAHGLALMGSLALNSTVVYYGAGSFQDPTNISIENGGQFVPLVANSGGASSNPNAKWVVRFNGSYTIPWQNIGVSAALDTRQGYPDLQTVNITSRPNSAGAVQVLIAPPGSVRLPNFAQLDLRIDKPFELNRTKLDVSFDIFNVMNANTILAEDTIQNAPNANDVTQILAPRILRLGVTFKW